MTLFKPTGSSLYYFKFLYRGNTYSGATGTADKRKAQKVEDGAREEAKRSYLLSTPEAAAQVGVIPQWEECVEAYLTRAEEDGGIVNQHDDESAFDRLTEWIGANTPITAITEETVRMCVRKRAAEPKCAPGTNRPLIKNGKLVPLSVATVNRQTWQLIRRVHEHAAKKMKVKNLEVIDWGEIAKGRPEPVRTREITLEEENRIINHADPGCGYAVAFRFGLLSGLRWTALCSLTWDRVNFETRDITVVNKRSARTKQQRTYTISIDSEMMKVLLSQKGRHPVSAFTFASTTDWVNPTNKRTYKSGQIYPVTPSGFDSWFDRVTAKAGINDIRIHDVRRTAGGRANRGAGLVTASKLLGHASVALTAKHYAHHTTDEQRDAQERAHEATRRRRERVEEMMRTRVVEKIGFEHLPLTSDERQDDHTDYQGISKAAGGD